MRVYVPLFLQLPLWSAWSPPTKKQAQVTPNKKSTETITQTFPYKGKNQMEEEIQP